MAIDTAAEVSATTTTTATDDDNTSKTKKQTQAQAANNLVAVRGNLLDLEHVWANADSPLAPYAPIPAHLRLGFYDGLPYWSGLTTQDIEDIQLFSRQVQMLLFREQCRFLWAGGYWDDVLAELKTVEANSSQTTPLDYLAGTGSNSSLVDTSVVGPKAAFTQVLIPKGLRVRRPRYEHTHGVNTTKTNTTNSSEVGAVTVGAEGAEHAKATTPVRVRWPRGGRAAIGAFVVEALRAENIQAWEVAHPDLLLSQYHVIGIATAPWFVRPNVKASTESGAIKHVAVALCKLDHWLFAG